MESAVVLFLSPVRNGCIEKYVGHIPGVGDVSFSGAETNDAPCKYLFHLAAANRDRISTVLCLVSQQVMDQNGGEPAFERFCAEIRKYLEEIQEPTVQGFYQNRPPQFVAIAYDIDPENKNAAVPTADRSNFIYRQIARSISQHQFRQLYIDYTGGFRDTGFLLMELSRFLGFVDIPCRQIVYSNYSEKRIFSLQSAYEMFPILSGISSFVHTGNAMGLQRAYRIHSHPLVDGLLESMTKFAQAVSVCAVGEIDEIWSDMDAAIYALEKHVPTADTDVTILMLRDFLPKIRKKLNIMPGINAPSYLSLIRWCLDNEMLQQAMTLFTEKIAQICFEEGLLTEKLLQKNIKNRKKKDQNSPFPIEDCHYTLHNYLFNYIAVDPDVAEFARYCKVLARNLSRNRRLDKAFERTNELRWRSGVLKAGRRLMVFIKSYFDRWDLRVVDPSINIYNKTLGDYGWDLEHFLDAISEEETRSAADYFVNNDYRRFSAMLQLRSRSIKRCALEQLSSNKIDVSELTRLNCRQLKEMMQHCYIIKLLRNQTNHASEEDVRDYQYFVQQGIFRNGVSMYEMSREALSDALDFFELLI
jgi:hypothetical protein